MCHPLDFDHAFRALTGRPPFPWQRLGFDEWFSQGRVPQTCSLPTGLGKTSVVAIWLIALASGARLPRRLVYVVNRRTVVDQTTDEVLAYRQHLTAAGLDVPLRAMCALPLAADESPLAISTLRGQFADNREWSADPARPAVICGTVDMIGSRLLFSGYRSGFKSRPLHAGFLGQDALLVHDEAHLEPAFQDLLTAIRNEQQRCGEFERFEVMELSATSRSGNADFRLTDDERRGDVPEVAKRLAAKKHLRLHLVDDEKGLADRIAQLAIPHRNSGKAILVYVRKVEDAEKVGARLRKEKLPVEMLTGTMRGLERDALVDKPVFRRFIPRAQSDGSTVYLVCTSAGEVGVNISGDHLVCDLTPMDSMAQRLGRVNRFGEGEATVDIVHPAKFEDESDDPYDHRRKLTLNLLERLNGDGSPAALERLPRDERLAAFSPPPATVPTSDILFDAWSLTTIHERLPGRPPVADFLHGKAEDWQPPDTYVAWRKEVEWIDDEVLMTLDLSELLDDYPLKPHELLRDRYDRVFKHLASLAEQHPAARVWLVRDDAIEVLKLGELAEREKEAVADVIVVLPPSVGGLTEAGTLGKAEGPVDLDVADEWFADEARNFRQRLRVEADDPELESKTAGMRLVRTLSVPLPEGEDEGDGESRREWQFYVRPKSADDEGSKTALSPVKLADHNAAVRRAAQRIAQALQLPEPITQALVIAAGHHDDGKGRALWQRGIGNRTGEPLAKSGHRRPPEITSSYRHEFGSLIDLLDCAEFQALDGEARELALHLVAAHHGRARPHFPADEAFDPEHSEAAAAGAAREVPRRFARLQRRFGRWGLAYLESLLRAADWAASTQVGDWDRL